MTRSSRFLLPFALVALAASLAVGVPRAAATDPFPTTGVVTLSSDHFMVHYSRDVAPVRSATITQEHAGDILGMAERAYAFYSAGVTRRRPRQRSTTMNLGRRLHDRLLCVRLAPGERRRLWTLGRHHAGRTRCR